MGVEFQPRDYNKTGKETSAAWPPPLVLGLQPAALVDHVAKVDLSLLSQIPGKLGGSFPVTAEELKCILSDVNTHILSSPDNSSSSKTMAGGSVANTIRGLAAGFGVNCGIIGASGDDEEGRLFRTNMSSYKVDLSRLRLKSGPTAQCVCLVDERGNRTMRPCLSDAVKVKANELKKEDFRGSKWLVVRYAIFNLDIIQAAIQMAKEEGLSVSLDLASFEMVRKFRLPLLQLLESRNIDLCFANEDEAIELLRGEEDANDDANYEAALEFLSKYCKWAVVTLGSSGCIAKNGEEVVRVPATGKKEAIDATGAGDLFAGGFLYGLMKGLSLEECCKIGSCSGGSVIRSLGGEVTRENWQWMYKQLQNKGLPVPDSANSDS